MKYFICEDCCTEHGITPPLVSKRGEVCNHCNETKDVIVVAECSKLLMELLSLEFYKICQKDAIPMEKNVKSLCFLMCSPEWRSKHLSPRAKKAWAMATQPIHHRGMNELRGLLLSRSSLAEYYWYQAGNKTPRIITGNPFSPDNLYCEIYHYKWTELAKVWTATFGGKGVEHV